MRSKRISDKITGSRERIGTHDSIGAMRRQRRKSLSVFFPCYNDVGTIGKLVDKAVRNLKKLTDDFEVIVVDDGSSDNSRELLLKKTQRYDCLKLVFHRKNKGYGGALIS